MNERYFPKASRQEAVNPDIDSFVLRTFLLDGKVEMLKDFKYWASNL